MVPPSRIELEIHPYHGCVMPFNYRGKIHNLWETIILNHFIQIIAFIFLYNGLYLFLGKIIMGIHYTYGANKNAKLMEKKAKKERKLAEKRAKRQTKEGSKKKVDVEKSLDVSKPITLDFLTNPDKKWIRKKKSLSLN